MNGEQVTLKHDLGAQQLATFAVGKHQLALPADNVIEALRMVGLTAIPAAPYWLPGVMDLRGEVVPVIDLGARLTGTQTPIALDDSILVIQTSTLAVGLIINVLHGLTAGASDDITPVPTEQANTVIAGITRIDDRLVMLLDAEALANELTPILSSRET